MIFQKIAPLILLICCCASSIADSRQQRKVIGTHVYEGIEVELAVEPVGHGEELDLSPGKSIRFLFSIRDTTTGLPVTGLFPAAWVQHRLDGELTKRDTKKMVETFVGGGIFAKPDIDLNVYHVITLNDNKTISVVDPLFGFGGSKLLSMIELPSVGKDWAKMTRAGKLFVSLPATNQIALVDTSAWSLSTVMPQVNRPTRLFLQPDEHFLWASIPEGVAVFKTSPFSFQYLIATGKGEHEIAFSPDNRFAYITNFGDNTLSVVSLSDFKVMLTLETGGGPTSVAYDLQAEAVYVSNQKSGTITCIDAMENKVYKTVEAEPGIGQIRFAPGGRWGFVVNPKTNRLSIFDSSLDRIVQSGLVDSEPYEITFSDSFAYIRHRQSANLMMVPLEGDSMGEESLPINTVDVPAGDSAYGNITHPTAASSIVQAPGANAVLVTNPQDKAVYFYKEGMSAPMGQFNSYGSEPRAVLVVDRSLREKSRPGLYETVARLDKAGVFDVAFFTNTPRMTLGYEMKVTAVDTDEEGTQQQTLVISPVLDQSGKQAAKVAGDELELRYLVRNQHGESRLPAQLESYAFMTSGGWRKRQAVDVSSQGEIVVKITAPRAGFYQMLFESSEPHIEVKQTQSFTFEVFPKP
ncbi:MAG: YncE family protein [Akkermansiaceae bacterium]